METANPQEISFEEYSKVKERMIRYRATSRFLERAKSTLYSQHEPGKEFLIHLKLGLLTNDVINMNNINDYESLNFELFEKGRSFEEIVKSQPKTHIDMYPDSLKNLRKFINENHLENENWDMFYNNYPIVEKDF